MTATQFNIEVNAPIEQLWETLLDELEHPESYSKTIRESTILERFANGVLRKVKVPDAEVRERLVFDFAERTIESTIVGHPELIGVITKSIQSGKGETLILNSSLEWKTVEPRVEAMLTRNVHDFMMEQLTMIKEKAEQAS